MIHVHKHTNVHVFLRQDQMADKDFQTCDLSLPHRVAEARLPVGLPAGAVIETNVVLRQPFFKWMKTKIGIHIHFSDQKH